MKADIPTLRKPDILTLQRQDWLQSWTRGPNYVRIPAKE